MEECTCHPCLRFGMTPTLPKDDTELALLAAFTPNRALFLTKQIIYARNLAGSASGMVPCESVVQGS